MKEVQKEREDSDFKAEKQREVLKKQMQKQKKITLTKVTRKIDY